MRERLQGVIANIPMCFNADWSMDETALRNNIRAYRNEGLEAMYLLGTSGELFNISPDEYRRAVRIFVEEAGPETLKVVGATSVRLGGILETVQWLDRAGADAVLAIPPHFIPLSVEERAHALRAIAEACPSLGIVHYNTSYAPEVKFEPREYAALLDVSNLWGTKQGQLSQEFWDALQKHSSSLRHLSLDDWMVASMKQGGYGAFSLLTSLAPGFAQAWYQACKAGEWERAEEMQVEFDGCMDRLYWPLSRRGYTDVAVDKALIEAFGFLQSSAPRPPLKPVSEPEKEWARELIQSEGYFRDFT